MKILAVDIGLGTQDVLLYDDRKNLENCVKLVLPSPTKIFMEKAEEKMRKKRNLLVKGEIIGGGPLKNLFLNHIKNGFKVVMTEEAAYTIRNSLEEVEALGIKIVKDENELEKFDGEILELKELDLKILEEFLLKFNEKIFDVDFVAVAVQDSGVAPKGVENRRFRLQKIREFLSKNPKPEALAFKEDEVPPYFLRMKSAVKTVKKQMPNTKILVMDTAPAAILGCLKDPKIEEEKPEKVLAVNAGNAHTMAAIVFEGENIQGIFEHHTRMLKGGKAEKLLKGFVEGKISDEDVRVDGGHGLFYLQGFKPAKPEKFRFVVTGPNRGILEKADIGGGKAYFAAPAGDVMMTGTFGLVEAVKRKFFI
ncbi:MAG: hypothetical protein DRO36_01830 [Candidatus Hecatellales archaeon]|nr:MAG: hypothetical protein DRO36_01830 [Candidatus Hecatellales archaeon]